MKLVTVRQISELLRISEKTIYDWVHKEKIPYYKLEGSLRFDFDEVLMWVKKKKHKRNGRVDVL